jgi:ATP-dependent Clp protease ATP-binding subunit ClpC
MSEQKDYWEKRSNNWISGRDTAIFENLTISNYVNNISHNKNVLYVGSGTGRYLCCFNCKKLYGIDFISDFIDVANKIKPDNCELFVDDIVDLKFDKNVDIAFTKTVLQHINSIQINKAIQNLRNLKIKDIISYLYSSKPNFVIFLNKRGISDKELNGAVDWVVYEIESREYLSQWWRPEFLSRIKGIADDWSFGKTFLLDKYSRKLMKDFEVSSEAFVISNRDTEISQIENALSKTSGSNAMLVGEPGQEKIQVVWSMCRNIKKGNIAIALKNKKPILLSVSSIASVCKDKNTLEDQIQKIFLEVIKAGNIILVIDNILQLLKLAESFGSDFTNIIDPFLASKSIQIVALANTADFHQFIESNKSIMNRFETILVRPLTDQEVARIVSGSALLSEKQYDITYTYQAIQELAESAGYYFPDGVSSDKAESLLNEIAPWAKRQNILLIDKNTVLEFIEQKTNIPTSRRVSVGEKNKLLNLEKVLGERVIGQDDAVLSISNALRRARSGVRNPNKPIGSFLFFGPTGVGKTETAKALSEVFFGGEKDMMRLDMSEYQTDDAMEKLIGSFASGKPGILSNMLREKQYGVVLLDEFEKTNKDVLNLFLQILDEGFFSDMMGQKVNTRNIIFIATSNVGAEKIFEMVKEGKNPKDYQEDLIAEIVSKGLFKPELINRFDGTIIFKPLNKKDLAKVGKLMLIKLSKRLIEKGITLNITSELINFVVKNGTNDAFGARPMNRFIQDSIEGKIATAMISGELKTGNNIDPIIEDNIFSIKVS